MCVCTCACVCTTGREWKATNLPSLSATGLLTWKWTDERGGEASEKRGGRSTCDPTEQGMEEQPVIGQDKRKMEIVPGVWGVECGGGVGGGEKLRWQNNTKKYYSV